MKPKRIFSLGYGVKKRQRGLQLLIFVNTKRNLIDTKCLWEVWLCSKV